MKSITQILGRAVEMGASDIHIFCGLKPRVRVSGSLVWLDDYKEVDEELIDLIMSEVVTEKQRKIFEETWELDTGFSVPGLGRYRGNFLRESKGPGCVFRLVPTTIPSLSEISMPPILGELAMLQQGIVLVTGPTGSGKSTTLAAMVSLINHKKRHHIITIEDPIEFIHPSIESTVTQREVGKDTKNFLVALRSALREDPDVILVGELRDAETMSMALRAAETGHLVLSTLHTTSAVGTINRFVETFPAESQEQVRLQLSETLMGVIAQRLLPRADDEGRICCVEVMIRTPAVAALIREGKTYQIASLIQTGRKQGMQLFDLELLQLFEEGIITRQTAYEQAMNKGAFAEDLKKVESGDRQRSQARARGGARPTWRGDQTGARAKKNQQRRDRNVTTGAQPAAGAREEVAAATTDEGFTLGEQARAGSWLFSDEDGPAPQGQAPLASAPQPTLAAPPPEERTRPPAPPGFEPPRGDLLDVDLEPPSGPRGPGSARPPHQQPPPDRGRPPSRPQKGGIAFRKPTLRPRTRPGEGHPG